MKSLQLLRSFLRQKDFMRKLYLKDAYLTLSDEYIKKQVLWKKNPNQFLSFGLV